MRVSFAQFNVEHDGKSYGVQMGVQYVADNRTYTTVTIYAVNPQGIKRILRSFSGSGRQMISPSNAKRFLRDTLIAEGVIKKPKPKEGREDKVRQLDQEIRRDSNVGNYGQLFDLKTTGGPVNDNRIPDPVPGGIIKKIKKLFFP